MNQIKRFENRVALITGGGSGIGRATALRFAQEGAMIAVSDINPVVGDDVCRQIAELGGKAFFILADVTKAADAERMVAETIKEFDRLDILFTAAGIGGGGDVVSISEDEWDRMLDLDLKAVYLSSKFAIVEMRKTGGGAIINISSLGGLLGDWGGASFSAAKGGVINLTRHIAVAHATENIRVNCICPGVIETPLTKNWLSDPEVRKSVTARHPMRRLGQPEEIAAVVAFLASDDASFITGAILAVDGGSLASGR
jgi:NAD(P)-dependent dehydrogenase (short-subunit alcohol dehydrogenase family)